MNEKKIRQTNRILNIIICILVFCYLKITLGYICAVIKKALDAFMPQTFTTEYCADDYQAFIVAGAVCGIVLYLLAYYAIKSRGKKHHWLLISVTVAAYVLAIMILIITVQKIHEHKINHMLDTLEQDFWLLTSFISGVLGGCVATFMIKRIDGLPELKD